MEKSIARNILTTSEIILLLIAYTVLLVLLVYIAGANYAYRYHEAMNIHDVSLLYSFQEFNPSAFLIALLLSSVCLYGFLKLNKVLNPLIIDWYTKRRNKQTSSDVFPYKAFPDVIMQKFVKNGVFVISLGVLLLILVGISQISGAISGEKALQNNNMIVSISSDSQLINDGQISVTESNGQFVYENLRLLTMYNGVYYLTRKIDPETCKPETVYPVDSSAVSVMTISMSDPNDSPCR